VEFLPQLVMLAVEGLIDMSGEIAIAQLPHAVPKGSNDRCLLRLQLLPFRLKLIQNLLLFAHISGKKQIAAGLPGEISKTAQAARQCHRAATAADAERCLGP